MFNSGCLGVLSGVEVLLLRLDLVVARENALVFSNASHVGPSRASSPVDNECSVPHGPSMSDDNVNVIAC